MKAKSNLFVALAEVPLDRKIQSFTSKTIEVGLILVGDLSDNIDREGLLRLLYQLRKL